MASELKLARELIQILEHSKSRTFTFGDLLHRLGVQGQAIFLILVVSPMLQPIPLPGVSSLLSVISVIIGFQILFHKAPWLPERYANKKIENDKLEKWLVKGLKLIEAVEKVCKPRPRFFGHEKVVKSCVAILILLASLLLVLPLPIPFSNFFPSVTIFLFAFGLLEDDGLFYFLGSIFFVVSSIYIGMILFAPFYFFH